MHLAGRAIQGGLGKGLGKLAVPGFGAEILYSFIIIACSLMIYFGTKELYELSSHKGIKYFRLAFLFFAFAYFSRSFIKFIITSFDIKIISDISPRALGAVFGTITIFIFMYFSAMAIFYLLYSVMWKKWKSKTIYNFHALALIMASATVILRTPLIYLAINLILLFFVTLTYYISRKQSHKKNSLHIIYILLFIFWTINILDILIPNFFQSVQLFIYLASSGVFLAILYKVLKKTGSN